VPQHSTFGQRRFASSFVCALPLKSLGGHVEDEPMTAVGSARAAALAIGIAVLATACSSPEDDVRADLLAEGLSETSVDCVISSFEDAGVDLDNLDDTSDLPPGAEFAMAGCMEGIFAEMFSEGFEEFGDEMAEAFEDLETDFDSDDAIAFTDNSEVDLGALVTSCQAGDNAACDDLWLASPFDSEEEQIAENCGGRAVEKRMGSCEFWLD
jgi:hypothetical protein